MKRLTTLCCILLLAGCAAPKSPSPADIRPESTTEEVAPEAQMPAAALELSELEPAEFWHLTMETPDTVSADISQWLTDSLEEAWLPLPVWDRWAEGSYTIRIMNWEKEDLSPVTEGYVVFTEENVQFSLPALCVQ